MTKRGENIEQELAGGCLRLQPPRSTCRNVPNQPSHKFDAKLGHLILPDRRDGSHHIQLVHIFRCIRMQSSTSPEIPTQLLDRTGREYGTRPYRERCLSLPVRSTYCVGISGVIRDCSRIRDGYRRRKKATVSCATTKGKKNNRKRAKTTISVLRNPHAIGDLVFHNQGKFSHNQTNPHTIQQILTQSTALYRSQHNRLMRQYH